MNVKELVIVGEEEIGKTTLANALLGWDIFPQSTWDLYIPTEETASKMLTESIRLIDTPGYDFLWYQVPDSVNEAVSNADTIIMMFTGFSDENDLDMENAPLEDIEEFNRWLGKLAKEEKLQKELLAKLQVRGLELNASALSKLEGQIRSVSDYELLAIAETLNSSVMWLLTGVDTEPMALSEE